MSALRRSDIKNKLVLMEPEDSYKDGDGDTSFQLKSDSLPHAHAQTTKTYYKHQDLRIKKAQELKTKTSANSDIQDLPLRYQVYQERLLASFQNDAKCEHFLLRRLRSDVVVKFLTRSLARYDGVAKNCEASPGTVQNSLRNFGVES
ncbi:hypothetical protein Tco_1537906 [Tanacetum coccineum]